MITTEYISFVTSLLSSLLGLGIVFLSLIFLVIYVTIVSKIISGLEKNLPAKAQAAPAPAAASAAVNAKPAVGAEAVKVAVIAAAISEERHEPLNSFVITNIKKL